MSVAGKHFYRFTYLKSEEWAAVRKMALAKAGARCKNCGLVSWSNDAHHKIYPPNIWDTTHRHLIVLCRKCHDLLHERLGKLASANLPWARVKKRIRANEAPAGITVADIIQEKRRMKAADPDQALLTAARIYLLTPPNREGKRKPSITWLISALLGWTKQQSISTRSKTCAP